MQPHDASGHMSPDEFRRLGRRFVDLVAEYMEGVGGLPVSPATRPGEVLGALPDRPPESGGGPEEWASIERDVRELVLPNTTHWQHPSFFGYFPCNTSGPAILGELLSAGLGVQGMLWQTAPASNELERGLLDQMGRAMGLPGRMLSDSANGGGCIQPTASDSTLAAMVAARRRVLERTGADPGSLTVYASSQAHSSVVKAALIAGLARSADDRARVRLIGTDGRYRMDPSLLRGAIESDLAAGLTPAYVCATVGTTGCTAVDPVGAIAGVLAETGAAGRGAWLHVDAAHAGVLLLCEEFRWLGEGLDRADSLCLNPHKWMLTTFDCDLFWTADRRSLVSSLSVTPEYLRNAASESGEVFDYRDWGVPLGRRFRALKLWFVLRHYGLAGIRAYVRGHVALAERFEAMARADGRFEVLAPRTMNLVCLGLRAGNAATERLLHRANATGRVLLTHTVLPTPGGDRYAMRMAVGSVATGVQHVDAAWSLLSELAEADAGR